MSKEGEMYEVVGYKNGKEEILGTPCNKFDAQNLVDDLKVTYGNKYSQIWYRKKEVKDVRRRK